MTAMPENRGHLEHSAIKQTPLTMSSRESPTLAEAQISAPHQAIAHGICNISPIAHAQRIVPQ
jgi:hypothetical protein